MPKRQKERQYMIVSHIIQNKKVKLNTSGGNARSEILHEQI